MPCYTTQRQSVEFKVEHFDLLEKAIKALGYEPRRVDARWIAFNAIRSIKIGNGKIDVDERDLKVIDQLKQAYSREAVKQAASRFGWAIKQKSENQLSIQKR